MIEHRRGFAGSVWTARRAVVLFAAVFLPVFAVQARAEAADRELEAAEQKIHALLREAEELQAAGRLDRAEAVRRTAEEMRVRLREQAARRERGEHDSPEARAERAGEELEAAEQKVRALRRKAAELQEAGQREKAERLRGQAESLLVRIRERDAIIEHARRDRADNELEAAEQKVRVLLREAAKLQEAGQREKAERLRNEAEVLMAGLRERAARADREAARERGPRDEDREVRRERDRPDRDRELQQTLEGLERGIAALRRLGRQEEVERLQRIANEVRAQLRRGGEPDEGEKRERRDADRDPRRDEPRPGSERAVALRQLEVMRTALPALRELERADAVEILERAIRAREVLLEGRRDDEARRIREGAPSREQMVEALSQAVKAWRQLGNEEKAAAAGQLAEELARTRDPERRDRPRGEGEGDRPRGEGDRPRGEGDRPRGEGDRPRGEGDRLRGEREIVANQLEVLVVAVKALEEAGRADAAERLERAVRARRAALEGRGDEEAPEIGEQAPTWEQQIELLMLAGRILREANQPERAEAVVRLEKQLRGSRERE